MFIAYIIQEENKSFLDVDINNPTRKNEIIFSVSINIEIGMRASMLKFLVITLNF